VPVASNGDLSRDGKMTSVAAEPTTENAMDESVN